MASENQSSESLDQSPDRGGGDFNAEDYVTPELEAKFAEVFGGVGRRDDNTGGDQPRVAGRANQREQQEELDEEAVASDEPAAEPEETPEPDESQSLKTKPAQKPASQEPAQDAALAAILSPMLRQAAMKAGWSKDEIESFYSANPDVAERTFARLQNTYNDLTNRYAMLGRQQPAAPAQPQQTAAPQSPASALDALFDPKALKEFAEANGEDIVEKVLKPLRAEVVEPLRQAMAWIAAREQEAIGQEINLTFKGWEEDFGDLYGRGKDVSDQQMQARREVGMLADQIRAGAALQGEQMSVSEALERAHMVLNAKHQAGIERKRITQALKTRSTRITARPTQRKIPTTAAEGAPRSEQAAMEAYAQRAAELGWNVG